MPDLMPLPEPPEGNASSMRAGDLVNKVCVFHPTELGTWPAKAAEHDAEGNQTKAAQKENPYVECDVWVLDRAGILETGSCRISWWKAYDQLSKCIGQYTAGKPMQEAGGRAISLVPLEGAAQKVAAQVVADLEGSAADEYEALGEEIF